MAASVRKPVKSILDSFRESDAFVFHTRLVHIGPALGERNTERAIERLSLLAQGWAGGTRIGDSSRPSIEAMLRAC